MHLTYLDRKVEGERMLVRYRWPLGDGAVFLARESEFRVDNEEVLEGC